MRRRIILFSAVVLALSAFSACKKNDTALVTSEATSKEVTKEIVLTEEQKEILREAGLPEDYDQLDAMQQINIRNIGSMLDYIEDKYHKDFVFYKYYADSTGSISPSMEVYPAGDKEHIVTIKLEEESYTDNYLELLSTREYEEAISTYIRENFPKTDFQVFSSVNSLEEGDGDILMRAQATSYVLMVNPFQSQEEALKAATGLIDYLKEKNGNKAVGIYYYMQIREQYEKNYISSATDSFKDLIYEYRISSNNNAVRLEKD